MTALVIIAKEPLPGRAKTRLHPPLSLTQAAAIAAACIDDTIEATRALPATERILFFDGTIVPAAAGEYRVVPQPEGSLDERLAELFDHCTGPTILIGMDTPQLVLTDLQPAFASWPEEVDAWFGPATDGGYWALGMREPRGEFIRGIPMSRSDTGARQLARLREAGLRVGKLPTLTDIDTIEAAVLAAAKAPTSSFARLVNEFLAASVNER